MRERVTPAAGRILARASERRFRGNWRPVLWSPATGNAGNALPGQLDGVVGEEDVESYLRLIRVPLDAAIERLLGNGTGAAPSARLVVDRADASVRAVLASLLRDPGLREDAQQRRTAAEKREQAMRLREEADRKSEQADSRLAEREAQAERRRSQAKERAKTQRQQAEQQRQVKAERAAEGERTRLDASRKAAARTDEKVEKLATKDRLDTLEAKTDALREKEQALTASDEARRPREATSRTKAMRKDGS